MNGAADGKQAYKQEFWHIFSLKRKYILFRFILTQAKEERSLAALFLSVNSLSFFLR